jgi:hypothetical protein
MVFENPHCIRVKPVPFSSTFLTVPLPALQKEEMILLG